MVEKENPRKIAVVRVRGQVDVRKPIKDTLTMMHLQKVNWATIIVDTPVQIGMLKKVKDFVTWGEIDEKTLAQLLVKWGRKAADKRLTEAEAKDFATKFMAGKTTFKEAGIKPRFKLHPPSKGHLSGGIKTHVSIGGVLGDRGRGIVELISKMGGLGIDKPKTASKQTASKAAETTKDSAKKSESKEVKDGSKE